ncbi:hypothetical protein GCM10010250_47920 [Streptomyces althioticus]|jgi:hypothetical protein|nr:hypothetical protein GCM10010250_47920 [Streptomyces althioticus]
MKNEGLVSQVLANPKEQFAESPGIHIALVSTLTDREVSFEKMNHNVYSTVGDENDPSLKALTALVYDTISGR